MEFKKVLSIANLIIGVLMLFGWIIGIRNILLAALFFLNAWYLKNK